MPIAKFTAQLSEKTALNSTYNFLHLELLEPHRIEFLAGQYILLDVPGNPQKRQYSIVSAPRLDHAIQLLVETIPGGKASTYLAGLNLGDQIAFFAPAGEFVVSSEVEASGCPLVFVGTGTGLAPLRSIILDQLRTKDSKRQIKLHWGMREASELFWLDYFEEIHKNYPNFSYDITLSQAPEAWTACKGRVTNCLAVHELLPDAHYYVCGNPNMINDVVDVLSGRGVPVTNLHREKFS